MPNDVLLLSMVCIPAFPDSIVTNCNRTIKKSVFMREKTEKILSENQKMIKRRRGQILVHSCLYYEMDSPIISDEKWQEWADDLEHRQSLEKDLYIDYYDMAFRDWTGATGAHLPHRDPWVYNKALYLLRISQK